MKTPISLRIEEDLLQAVQQRAKEENESLNGFIEKLLEYFMHKNKYAIAKMAKALYESHVLVYAEKGITNFTTEYLVTNGLDHLFTDSLKHIDIDEEDYVYQCWVSDDTPQIKLITEY